MPTKFPIRVFLSSPGDVNAERKIARTILDELKHDPQYKDKMDIDIVAWDDPHSDVLMPVTLTPQEAINRGLPKPSECEVVITIFWGRMGTPLDEAAHGLKADGTLYWSGTEWEYLDAVQGSSTNPLSLPIVYLYRRTDEAPQPKPREGQTHWESMLEYATQGKRVEEFFKAFRDAKTGAFKSYYHEYDSLDAFNDLMKKHLRILLTHAYDRVSRNSKSSDQPPDEPVKLPLEWDIANDGSPFPGLKSFEARHAKVYFGRAREAADVLKRMVTQRLQVIVGASGSGKSSLVKAGVLPKLTANALPPSARWHQVIMRPASAPFVALQVALQEVFPPALVDSAETLAKAPENLHRMLARLPKGEETVLFIDQFEELFTSAKDDAEAFIAMLKYPSAYLRVLVTIRSDFYDVLLTHFEKELRESTFTLAKPSAVALVEMITRPAEVSGLAFDAGLVERIVEDAGTDAGALALIAYMLDELYNAARQRGTPTLTLSDYVDFGGVQKVIGTRAEQVFTALRLANPDKTLQRVFHALVTVDERSTRQSANRHLFAHDAEAERLIDAFIEARLFTSDKGQIEVAHEALLREWKPLTEWIVRSREQRMIVSRMQREAGIWQERGKPDHLRPNAETLKDFHEACDALQIDPHSLGIEDAFIEPEQERLYRELDTLPRDDSSHERRREIGDRLASIGDTRKGVGVKRLPSPSEAVGSGAGVRSIPDIEWLLVKGSKDKHTFEFGEFTVPDFYISKYLVTYAQYQVFAESDYANPQWWEGFPDKYRPQPLRSAKTKMANAPRDTISWYQAVAFSRWLEAKYREYGLFETLLLPSPPTPLPNAVLGEGLQRPLKGEYRAKANDVMVSIARDLRQRETTAEERLWACLRDRRLAGLKFRRQHPVADTPYVVDFFCYEYQLVVELDGGIHAQQYAEDARRQAELERLGLRVLRFPNDSLYTELENVLARIAQTALDSAPPSNAPDNAPYSDAPGNAPSSNALGNASFSDTLGSSLFSDAPGNASFSATLGSSPFSDALGNTPSSNALGNASFSHALGSSPLPDRASDRSGEGSGVRANHWQIRLPTEWEWQWAAQNGTEARAFPWGDWREGYANTSATGINRTTGVGMYPQGAAACGALDMAGNLQEWCLNDYDEPEILDGYSNGETKVLRGGSFNLSQVIARVSIRNINLPNLNGYNRGFRLCLPLNLRL